MNSENHIIKKPVMFSKPSRGIDENDDFLGSSEDMSETDLNESFISLPKIKKPKLPESIKAPEKTLKKALPDPKDLKKIGNTVEKGVTGGIDELLKILKEFIPYLEKIGDFFKNWTKILDFIKDPKHAIAIILTLTVPVIGQIIARFMLFNGSLDHLWLMLFALPPFTIVPALAMIFGYIKKLEGGSPWDNMIWIPLLLNTFGMLFFKEDFIIRFFMTVGSFMFVYWYKSKKECNKEGGASLSKITMDSFISYSIVLVLSIVLPYIPYIGNFFMMFQAIVPRSELFFQAFTVFIVYVGTNLLNGSFEEMCKIEYKTNNVLYVGLLTAFLAILTNYSPGNIYQMIDQLQP